MLEPVSRNRSAGLKIAPRRAGELFNVAKSAGGRRTEGGDFISWHRQIANTSG